MGTSAATETFTIPDELFSTTPIYDALVAVHPDPRFPAPAPVVDVKPVDVKKTAAEMARVAAATKK